MEKEKTLQELVSNLVTVTQRDYFLDSIEVLEKSLFATHQTIFELTSLALSLPWSDIVLRMYHEQNLIDQDKDACRAILESIKTAVKHMETVEIRVAYNITDADVRDIRNWFFFQLKKNMLLNIIVDPSIIGGIIIYRNGIYKDYSVAHYIEQYGSV